MISAFLRLARTPALDSVVDEELGRLYLEPYDHIVQKSLSGFAETFRTLRLRAFPLCRTVKLVAITFKVDEGKTTSSSPCP